MLSNEQYLEQLNAYVDLASSLLPADQSAGETAKEMGLSTSTLLRLLAHETQRPQFLTVQKLGHYTGLHLIDNKGRPQMMIRKRTFNKRMKGAVR